jgi:hypothetical protein
MNHMETRPMAALLPIFIFVAAVAALNFVNFGRID